MCGMFGVIRTTKDIYGMAKLNTFFSEALYADALRGPHATGVFSVETDHNQKTLRSFYAKDPTNAVLFLGQQRFQQYLSNIMLNSRAVFGHNRYATVGSRGVDGAHPHLSDHVTLIHNGTLKDYEFLPLSEHGDSDSARLCEALSQAEPGGIDVWEKLYGAYACLWYDNRSSSVYAVRNTERPLDVFANKLGVFFASEGRMAQWILDRNNILDTKKQPKALPTHKVYQWKLSPTSAKEVGNEKYQPPIPKPTVTYVNQKEWWRDTDGNQYSLPKPEEAPGSALSNAYLANKGIDLKVGETIEIVWTNWESKDPKSTAEVQFGTVRGFLDPVTEGLVTENNELNKPFEGTIYVVVNDVPYNVKEGRIMETMTARIVRVIASNKLLEEDGINPGVDVCLRCAFVKNGQFYMEHEWKEQVLLDKLDEARWYYDVNDTPKVDTPLKVKLTHREVDILTCESECRECGVPANDTLTTNINFINTQMEWVCTDCKKKIIN